MSFNLNRFGLLIRNDFLINKQNIMLAVAALTGVLFLFGIMSPTGAMGHNFHPTIYLLLLFVGGFWCTSRIFSGLHDRQKSYTFLTLPASNLEKLCSKLLLTSIGYVLITLVYYFIVSLLVVGFSKLLFPDVQYLFNPFSGHILSYCGEYIVLQSIFFLGVIYFKNQAFIKTALVVLLFVAIFWLISLFAITAFTHRAATIFWIILAPICWLVAYFRLREVEA